MERHRRSREVTGKAQESRRKSIVCKGRLLCWVLGLVAEPEKEGCLKYILAARNRGLEFTCPVQPSDYPKHLMAAGQCYFSTLPSPNPRATTHTGRDVSYHRSTEDRTAPHLLAEAVDGPQPLHHPAPAGQQLGAQLLHRDGAVLHAPVARHAKPLP